MGGITTSIANQHSPAQFALSDPDLKPTYSYDIKSKRYRYSNITFPRNTIPDRTEKVTDRLKRGPSSFTTNHFLYTPNISKYVSHIFLLHFYNHIFLSLTSYLHTCPTYNYSLTNSLSTTKFCYYEGCSLSCYSCIRFGVCSIFCSQVRVSTCVCYLGFQLIELSWAQ